MSSDVDFDIICEGSCSPEISSHTFHLSSVLNSCVSDTFSGIISSVMPEITIIIIRILFIYFSYTAVSFLNCKIAKNEYSYLTYTGYTNSQK